MANSTDNAKIVTGDTLKYFKQKQDDFNTGKFVAQVEGKVLSTNDYTTEEKNKLAGIEAGAKANKIEHIKLNGADLTIDSDKRVDFGSIATSEALTVLTNRVTTAEGNITTLQSSKQDVVSFADGYDASTNQAATVKTVTDAVAEVTSFEFEIVTDLPSTGEKGIIYLKKHSESGSDMYEEFIWINDRFEKIGDTRIDLTNYYTKTETDSAISTAVSAETSRATGAESNLQDAIADEVTRATEAEETNAGNITSLTTRVETAEGKIDTLQSGMTTAKSDITTLQSDMTAVQGDIDELESDVATAKTNITTLQGKVGDTPVSKQISDAVAAEETRAIAAEGALSVRLDTVENNVAGAISHAAAKGSAVNAVLGKVTSNEEGHVTAVEAATYSDLPISIDDLHTTLGVVTEEEIDGMFTQQK